MAHTPGPWKFDDKGDHRILSESPPLCMALVTGGLDGEAEFGPTSAANGRLIAAAPELLDACQTLIRYCSSRDGTLNTYEDWLQCFVEDGSTITEAVEKAQSAIAKAEGR